MSAYQLFRVEQCRATKSKSPYYPTKFCYRCEKEHGHTRRCASRGFCKCRCGCVAFFSGRRPS